MENYPHKLNKELQSLLNEGSCEKIEISEKPGTKTVEIKPSQARYILQNHSNKDVKNRKVSANTIKKYAHDMKNGDWKFTGDSFCFSKGGGLMQGQHRLFAILSSDTPITVNVTTGLERESFNVMDQGRNRQLKDILDCNDQYGKGSSTKVLAPMVRLAWMYSNDKMKWKGSSSDKMFTRQTAIKFLQENPDLIHYTERYKDCRILSASVASFLFWLFSQYDSEAAEVFLDRALTGVNLQKDTPEYLLNQKLVKNSTQKQRKLDKLALICNCFIAWRRYIGLSKANTTKICWDTTKKIPSPFPEGFQIQNADATNHCTTH